MSSSTIEGVDDLQPYLEPVGGEFGAKKEYARPKAPYDHFMESEGIPIVREVGVRDIRKMELSPWARTGGNGAYVQLLGTEELWGMYVVEILPGGALNPEHHLYEETFYVVEGRGSTEIWIADDGKRTSFEWQTGSLFSVPLNSTHRLVNATNKPARLIVATTAPSLMNHFRNNDFIFNSNYRFTERYDGAPGFFDFNDALYKGSMGGRAMMVTSIIPDLVNTTLPLDNQRSPGYRRIEPYMANNSFYVFVGEHVVGKYSKGHFHPPSPVLVCIKGGGYTYTWPRELGPTPWADGNGDKVIRQDYVAGGMVAAAPGGGDWYHQHFGVSDEPLRFLYFGGLIRWGAFNAGTRPGEVKTSLNVDIDKGGSSIAYYQEDPHIRREFEESLARNGVSSIMPEELYQWPDGK